MENMYTPVERNFTLTFALILILIYLLTATGMTHGGSSTVQFTHKQYKEQHNETQYLERKKHNNKNT